LSRTIYDKPPLFEVGISLFTEAFGLVDAYDVRALHDLYRSEFPLVERQLPIIPGSSAAPFQVSTPDDDHHRWWFISQDGHNLLQLQSNFMARNWRRMRLPGGDMPPYEGFIALLDSLQQCWDIREVDLTKRGLAAPQPARVEVFYDNLIPADGQRLRDILTGVQLSGLPLMVGFNMGWSEPLPKSASGQLLVEVRYVSAEDHDGRTGSYIRVRLVARDEVSSIAEVVPLLTEAHEAITDRLHHLTTDSCRATWGAQ
jgi:uncharacterized protein (TIGR04255 family)